MRLHASVQAGDDDRVVSGQGKHRQFAIQYPSALQVLLDLVRVLADLGELTEDFGQVYCADRRAANQRVLDHLGASFIAEIGEKGRGVQHTACVFQSARRCLSLGFRSPFGNEFIDKRSGSCPCPVKPPRLSDGQAGARQA